jgi:uncharacterized protein
VHSATPARRLIEQLSLLPHPEGGWYREIYRSTSRIDTPRGSRSALTTIYYLLERNQLSRWHVVASDEVWHHYGGAPLELLAYAPATRRLLRRMLASPGDSGGAGDAEPVAVIERGTWQAARSLGDYSLLGCTVGPGFEFADFQFVAALADHAAHFTGTMADLKILL